MWILWRKDVGLMEPPSHYCHVTSYLRTCHSWMTEDEVIPCTNNQSPIEILALCGLLSYLPSFLSTPILTLYPGPGPHHFSLATLFHCPDASPSGQTFGMQPLRLVYRTNAITRLRRSRHGGMPTGEVFEPEQPWPSPFPPWPSFLPPWPDLLEGRVRVLSGTEQTLHKG